MTLKRDVPLYSAEEPDVLVATALKGEKGVLMPDLSEVWLILKTDSGKVGLVTFCGEWVAGREWVVGGYMSWDIFEGLCQAD